MVELHGYVKVQSAANTDDQETETKIEYIIITEIEWAERFSNFRKKVNGTRISMMDFNSMIGQSKKMMRDSKLFST